MSFDIRAIQRCEACGEEMHEEIATLRADNARLTAELARVTTERDDIRKASAVADMRLRGKLAWAGDNWGAPASLAWAVDGIIGRLRETESLLKAVREDVTAERAAHEVARQQLELTTSAQSHAEVALASERTAHAATRAVLLATQEWAEGMRGALEGLRKPLLCSAFGWPEGVLEQLLARIDSALSASPTAERGAAVVKVLEAAGPLRPEVLAFARAMEWKLRANAHKPGWKGDEPLALVRRLHEEAGELSAAVWKGGPPAAVLAEAADVGNFAMMVADAAGVLDRPEGRAAVAAAIDTPPLAASAGEPAKEGGRG